MLWHNFYILSTLVALVVLDIFIWKNLLDLYWAYFYFDHVCVFFSVLPRV